MSLHSILGTRWGLMFKLYFMGRRWELDKIIHILLGTVITGKERNPPQKNCNASCFVVFLLRIPLATCPNSVDSPEI